MSCIERLVETKRDVLYYLYDKYVIYYHILSPIVLHCKCYSGIYIGSFLGELDLKRTGLLADLCLSERSVSEGVWLGKIKGLLKSRNSRNSPCYFLSGAVLKGDHLIAIFDEIGNVIANKNNVSAFFLKLCSDPHFIRDKLAIRGIVVLE